MKEKTIEYYLEFLRYSLNADSTVVPQSASEIQWHDLLAFAKRHAVVGIYWMGIQKMMASENRPELKYWTGDDDVLAWMAQVQKIKINNTKLYNRCVQICHTFEKDGFASCILRGQGNALMYPDPYIRTSGDIDIWVWPKKSKKLKLETLSKRRKEIVKYVCKECCPREVEYHHVDYPIYKNAPVY